MRARMTSYNRVTSILILTSDTYHSNHKLTEEWGYSYSYTTARYHMKVSCARPAARLLRLKGPMLNCHARARGGQMKSCKC